MVVLAESEGLAIFLWAAGHNKTGRKTDTAEDQSPPLEIEVDLRGGLYHLVPINLDADTTAAGVLNESALVPIYTCSHIPILSDTKTYKWLNNRLLGARRRKKFPIHIAVQIAIRTSHRCGQNIIRYVLYLWMQCFDSIIYWF